MSKQCNLDKFFGCDESNIAMGGVLAINVCGNESDVCCIHSFMPIDMTKEKAREKTMPYMQPGSDLTSCSDEEVAEYLINYLAYWLSFGLKELGDLDPEEVNRSLKHCAALISVLTDTNFWGVTADLENDGFMNQYKFKSLTKDVYIECIEQCLNYQSASN